MKKILAFDSWTGGAHHFERLVPSFRERGFEVKLVHLGSWGVDPGRPLHEMIGFLPASDIACYGNNIKKVLDTEAPEAVVFLSTQTFAHRTLIRYCRLRNVPTLNLYHGLIGVMSQQDHNPGKVALLAKLKFIASRVRKVLTRVLPGYLSALWATRAPVEDWARMLKDSFGFLIQSGYGGNAAADSKTTAYAVYTNADVTHTIRRYGCEAREVAVVGNPDLGYFGFDQSHVGSRALEDSFSRQDIMYIDTGFVLEGMVFSDDTDFFEHLDMTNKALKRQNRKLVVKLKQLSTRKLLVALLRKSEIRVVDNAEFVSSLESCSAAIVEPSTAALIPALIGIPLLLAQYGKLADQRYGPVLVGYPRARTLPSIAQAVDILQEERQSVDRSAVLKWIESNVGPMPHGTMADRVADVVEELVGRTGVRCVAT